MLSCLEVMNDRHLERRNTSISFPCMLFPSLTTKHSIFISENLWNFRKHTCVNTFMNKFRSEILFKNWCLFTKKKNIKRGKSCERMLDASGIPFLTFSDFSIKYFSILRENVEAFKEHIYWEPLIFNYTYIPCLLLCPH